MYDEDDELEYDEEYFELDDVSVVILSSALKISRKVNLLSERKAELHNAYNENVNPAIKKAGNK
ncbi:MAG: hypothetical protein K5768_08765 [Firmicutes bacterium]|nr:hypothetical protein [Bacillota bacterium]